MRRKNAGARHGPQGVAAREGPSEGQEPARELRRRGLDAPRGARSARPLQHRSVGRARTILKRGKQGIPTEIPASHRAYFDWTYPNDFPEMAELYARAKRGQWNGDDLPWETSVDPLDPTRPLLPEDFFAFDVLEDKTGVRFDEEQRMRFRHDFVSRMLSQFLHGEQGRSSPPRRSPRRCSSSTASSTAPRRWWTRAGTSRCSTATSTASWSASTRSTTTSSSSSTR
ncbi:MAG: hypothetical protein M5U28_02630 [Sandaracinaceae bacterium]|nr:hypothetical protein [Sandaracinaceae bacterium]